MLDSWENGGGVEQDLHGYSRRITEEGENFGKFQCNLCGRVNSKRKDAFYHVESRHFPGTYEYLCDQDHCEEKFNTKNKWYTHRTKVHFSKKSE